MIPFHPTDASYPGFIPKNRSIFSRYPPPNFTILSREMQTYVQSSEVGSLSADQKDGGHGIQLQLDGGAVWEMCRRTRFDPSGVWVPSLE
jgi:hypothetical protein